jgi:hypothetical protein
MKGILKESVPLIISSALFGFLCVYMDVIGFYLSAALAFLSVGLMISSIWLGKRAIIWGLAGLFPFVLVLIFF